MREAMGDPMLGPEQSMDCDPWKTDAADWPADGSPDEKLIFLLNYAVLAPSILNTQPWRFHLADGLLRLEEDTSRRMMVVDRDGRESTISCGAALTNLLVAARSFGHDLEIKIAAEAPSTDTLATIRLGDRQRRPSDADRRLREAIRIRRTVRLGFEPKPVDPAILQEFASLARQFNVQMASIVEFERKRTVAQLVGEAEKIHLKDPEFREEIRHWLQLRRSEDHESLREFYVRMGSASGHSPQSGPRLGQGTLTGADIARTFATPEAASERQYALAESSPVLLVLATAGDSRSDWLSAGQALQRVLLAAAVGGLSASYLNPPIEIPQLRDEIAKAFDIDFKPQVLFRLGHGESISPTPRRPIGEVLIRRVSAP